MGDGKVVYRFGGATAEGSAAMRALLGGKGAGLHEMTRLGVRVPPGFTIVTTVCRYAEEHGGAWPEGLEAQIDEALAWLGEQLGRRFGDPRDPLLVSVRSGAAVSMPGMMDTVLNLGLNRAGLEGFGRRCGGKRVALDAYRRLIEMFATVVRGLDRAPFEQVLAAARQRAGVRTDAELGEPALEEVVAAFEARYREGCGEPFPQDPQLQLRAAIDAVLRSWNSERARTYRRLQRIEGLAGTAVNVQAMVFGNAGQDSGTGVCFTRNPSTGQAELYGEFLVQAQGEDVVAGIRTPEPIARLAERMPEAYRELLAYAHTLERHFGDMQDIEFTVECGTLYVLQTRSGKRTGRAALRIAVALEREGVVGRERALSLVGPEHVEQVLYPSFDPEARARAIERGRLLGRGLPAAPGVATGTIALHPEEAEAAAAHGARVILVRHETSPEDVGGMAAAQGVLTATGGMTSHAAVVARGMGKPCVVGLGELEIDVERGRIVLGGRIVRRNEPISIDGATGEVFLGALATRPSPVIEALVAGREPESEQDRELLACFRTVLGWADAVRRLRVRANADTPEDARLAVALGAEGIGLCRTEHMFFAPERIPIMRAMILARDEAERARALERMAPLQRADFVAILRAMGSRPVTIRLLDPPLHEFLPEEPEQQAELAAELGRSVEEVAQAVAALRERNPMLGHRGCRLGLTHPEIYAMQVRAIAHAAFDLAAEGLAVRPEIMMPLVASGAELERLREQARQVIAQVRAERGAAGPAIAIGTMIEVPRACVVADAIAAYADFFSFGTNDLTQCTWGISRDDGGSFLPHYLEAGLLRVDPFAVLDRAGVGALMRIAVERGRGARASLHVGICGEHGGEPSSIAFCEQLGLDYVSCSPYRLPVARLAAAHARLATRSEVRGG